MKQKGKDRQRRLRADSHWKARMRRKAERKEERRRARDVARKYPWRRNKKSWRGLGILVRAVGKAEREQGTKERRQRGKQLEQREGRGTRVRNRCLVTGYGRSVRRWFRRSGRKAREKARRGKLQGVYGVSW
jgi:ribosomal protein S14